MRRALRHVITVLAIVSLLAACIGGPGGPGAPPSPPDPSEPATAEPSGRLTVVTSTTILADLARQVGGDRVSVQSLMPAGRDPHTFDPAPSDAALLARADLLLMNGVGLDEWLAELAGEAAPNVPLVVVGEDLAGVDYLEGDDADEQAADEPHDDHGHNLNPHLWLDAANARLYVSRIAAALVAADDAGRSAYDTNLAAYDAALAELDVWIRGQLESVPAENRRAVSLHDAFPYYARAYGIEIVGVVIDSPGQEPSAAEIARLAATIRESGARAVLSEIQFSDRLAQVLADETGARVVHGLYTDSLGDPPHDTYEAVMRRNTERIVDGLR